MKLQWPVAPVATTTIPPNWWVSVGFAQNYRLGVHTGLDFNLHNFADSGKPVYSIADGEVVFAADGALINWHGARGVVCIKHANGLWSRYAHLVLSVQRGQSVKAGEVIGTIGDYGAPGKADDHLHFDLSTLDLGVFPGDWPGFSGSAMNRVRTHYLDPFVIYRLVNG